MKKKYIARDLADLTKVHNIVAAQQWGLSKRVDELEKRVELLENRPPCPGCAGEKDTLPDRGRF